MPRKPTKQSSVNISRPFTPSNKQNDSNTNSSTSGTSTIQGKQARNKTRAVTYPSSASPRKSPIQPRSESEDPLLLTNDNRGNSNDPETCQASPITDPLEFQPARSQSVSPHLPTARAPPLKRYGRKPVISLSDTSSTESLVGHGGRVKGPPDKSFTEVFPRDLAPTKSSLPSDSSALPPSSPFTELGPSQQSSVLTPPPSPSHLAKSSPKSNSLFESTQSPSTPELNKAFADTPPPWIAEPVLDDVGRGTTGPISESELGEAFLEVRAAGLSEFEEPSGSVDLSFASCQLTSPLPPQRPRQLSTEERPPAFQEELLDIEEHVIQILDRGDTEEEPLEAAPLPPTSSPVIVASHTTPTRTTNYEPSVFHRSPAPSPHAQTSELCAFPVPEKEYLPPTPPPTAILPSHSRPTPLAVSPITTPAPKPPVLNSIINEFANYRRLSGRIPAPVNRYSSAATGRASNSRSVSPVKREEVASQPSLPRRSRSPRKAPVIIEPGSAVKTGLELTSSRSVSPTKPGEAEHQPIAKRRPGRPPRKKVVTEPEPELAARVQVIQEALPQSELTGVEPLEASSSARNESGNGSGAQEDCISGDIRLTGDQDQTSFTVEARQRTPPEPDSKDISNTADVDPSEKEQTHSPNRNSTDQVPERAVEPEEAVAPCQADLLDLPLVSEQFEFVDDTIDPEGTNTISERKSGSELRFQEQYPSEIRRTSFYEEASCAYSSRGSGLTAIAEESSQELNQTPSSQNELSESGIVVDPAEAILEPVLQQEADIPGNPPTPLASELEANKHLQTKETALQSDQDFASDLSQIKQSASLGRPDRSPTQSTELDFIVLPASDGSPSPPSNSLLQLENHTAADDSTRDTPPGDSILDTPSATESSLHLVQEWTAHAPATPGINTTGLSARSSLTEGSEHWRLHPSPIIIDQASGLASSKQESTPRPPPVFNIAFSRILSDDPVNTNTTPPANKLLSDRFASPLTPLSQDTPSTHLSAGDTPSSARERISAVGRQLAFHPVDDHDSHATTFPPSPLRQKAPVTRSPVITPRPIPPETTAPTSTLPPVLVDTPPRPAPSPSHSISDSEDIIMAPFQRKRKNRIESPPAVEASTLPSTPTNVDSAVLPSETDTPAEVLDAAHPGLIGAEPAVGEEVTLETAPVIIAATPARPSLPQASQDSPLTPLVEREKGDVEKQKAKGYSGTRGKGKAKGTALGGVRGEDDLETSVTAGKRGSKTVNTQDVEMEEAKTSAPAFSLGQEENTEVVLGREEGDASFEHMGHAPTPTGQSAPTPPPNIFAPPSPTPDFTPVEGKAVGGAKRKRKTLDTATVDVPSPAPTTASTASSVTTKIKLKIKNPGTRMGSTDDVGSDGGTGKKEKRKASEDVQLEEIGPEKALAGDATVPSAKAKNKGGRPPKKPKVAEANGVSVADEVAQAAGLGVPVDSHVAEPPVIAKRKSRAVRKNRVESRSPTPEVVPTTATNIAPSDEPEVEAKGNDLAKGDQKSNIAAGAGQKKPTGKAKKQKVGGEAFSTESPAVVESKTQDEDLSTVRPLADESTIPPGPEQVGKIRNMPKIAKNRAVSDDLSGPSEHVRKKPRLPTKSKDEREEQLEDERKGNDRDKEKEKIPEKPKEEVGDQSKVAEKPAPAIKPTVKKTIPTTTAPPARAPGLLSATLAMLNQPATSTSTKKLIKGKGNGKGVEATKSGVVQGSNGMDRPVRPGGWVMSASQQAEYDSHKAQRDAEMKAREAWDEKPINLAPIGDVLREKARLARPVVNSTRGWTSFVGATDKVGGFWFDPLTMSKREPNPLVT